MITRIPSSRGHVRAAAAAAEAQQRIDGEDKPDAGELRNLATRSRVDVTEEAEFASAMPQEEKMRVRGMEHSGTMTFEVLSVDRKNQTVRFTPKDLGEASVERGGLRVGRR